MKHNFKLECDKAISRTACMFSEGVSHLYMYSTAVRLLPNNNTIKDSALAVLGAVKTWREELDEVFIFDR